MRNFASARRIDAMAASLLAKLPKKEQEQLLDDLNYLNIAEIKSFCERRSIPYRITIETEKLQARKTGRVSS